MNYHVTVYTNEILIEVRIATDPRPGAGFISACKLLYDMDSQLMPPATVRISASWSYDLTPDEIDNIQRWLTEAASMARQLDEEVTEPSDFTEAVRYEVRQVAVAGILILDKVERVNQ